MRGVVAGAAVGVFVGVFLPSGAMAHGIGGVVAACEKQAGGVGASLRVASARPRAVEIEARSETVLVVSEWRDEASIEAGAQTAAVLEVATIAGARMEGRMEGLNTQTVEIDREKLPSAFAVRAQQPPAAMTGR